jgi:putative ABC transport system substrate-binding protein
LISGHQAFLIFAVAGSAAAAPRPTIAVVKSDNLAPYARLVSTFSMESKGDVVEYDLKGSEEKAEKTFSELREKAPALVLAVGPIAANAARRILGGTPVVFVMVPNYEKYGLEAKNVTGIALTLPPKFQFQTLHALVSTAKRIGVVYSAAFSQPVIDVATADAASLGLTLVPSKAESPEEVGRAIKSLGRVDALWMIADRTAANAASVKKLLEFAQLHSLPILALSEGQVKDGALLSLAPTPAGLGGQAARLANRIVFEKIDPGALAVQQPDSVDLAVNLTTAKSLSGGGCDVATNVLRFASQNGYLVHVYE